MSESKSQIFSSLKWSFASEIVTKAISPIVFIVLSRLLTPKDFGVMAAATMVIAFTQMFWEAGMSKALIQTKDDLQIAANIAFFSNIILGSIVTLFIYSFSDLVAETFFQDDRVGYVLKFMSLQVFLGAFASVHIALMQRAMKFDSLFKVRFLTVGLPALASIPMALNGMAYWSLVAGSLIGQLAQVVFLWKISDWRPTLIVERGIFVNMVRFGIWIAISSLLGWFYLWADSLIVGMCLGSHDLGLYRNGNQFVNLIFLVSFGSLLPVTYSYFSRQSENEGILQKILAKAIHLLTIVAIPVSFIIYAVSEPLADLVFGTQWSGIGFVIGILGLSNGYAWVVGLNGEAYRAIGKPQFETVIMLIACVVYLPLYILAAKQGFETFVKIRFFATVFVGLNLHLIFLKRYLNISLGVIFLRIIFVTILSYISVLFVSGLDQYANCLPMQIAFKGALLTIIFFVFLYCFERKGIFPLLIQVINKSKKC